MSSYKLIGILGIFFGLVPFLPFFTNRSFILPDSDVFFIKYVLIISFINCGLGFIVLGILTYLGTLTPYHFANKYEKAKLHLVTIPIMLPILISWTVLIYSDYYIVKTWLRIVWPLLVIWALYTLFSSIKLLRKGKEYHQANN